MFRKRLTCFFLPYKVQLRYPNRGNKMSIENRMSELSAELAALTALLKSSMATPEKAKALVNNIVNKTKALREDTKPEETVALELVPVEVLDTPIVAAVEETVEVAEVEEEVEEVTYMEVQTAILAAAKVSRTGTVNLLLKYGADRGPALKKEDYARFLAEIKLIAIHG